MGGDGQVLVSVGCGGGRLVASRSGTRDRRSDVVPAKYPNSAESGSGQPTH